MVKIAYNAIYGIALYGYSSYGVMNQDIESTSHIFKQLSNSLYSSSYILVAGEESSFVSNSFLCSTSSNNLSAISHISTQPTSDILSNSNILITNKSDIDVEAYIKKLALHKTLSGISYIKDTNISTNILSGSTILVRKASSIQSLLTIKEVSTFTAPSLSSDSVLTNVGNCIITYPVTGDTYILNDINEYVLFIIPTVNATRIHVQLQIDSASDFSSPAVSVDSSINSGIFEYYDGSSWKAWSTDGIPYGYGGNPGRANIYNLTQRTDLSLFYIRMRGILR